MRLLPAALWLIVALQLLLAAWQTCRLLLLLQWPQAPAGQLPLCNVELPTEARQQVWLWPGGRLDQLSLGPGWRLCQLLRAQTAATVPDIAAAHGWSRPQLGAAWQTAASQAGIEAAEPILAQVWCPIAATSRMRPFFTGLHRTSTASCRLVLVVHSLPLFDWLAVVPRDSSVKFVGAINVTLATLDWALPPGADGRCTSISQHHRHQQLLGQRGWEVMNPFSSTDLQPQSSPVHGNCRQQPVLRPLLTCDKLRARGFHQANDIQPNAQDKFTIQATQLLKRLTTVLDNLGITFWLSSGTLLGWFRQCGFIPYTQDVDIGMFADEYDPGMLGPLKQAGLTLTHKFGTRDDGLELSLTDEQGLKVDVFFFYKERQSWWNGGTQARTGRKFRYDFTPFALCWTRFGGIDVRVPCDGETYIQANYGPKYMTPVSNWDWKQSPPNVREVGAWPRESWPRTVNCPVCPYPADGSILQL